MVSCTTAVSVCASASRSAGVDENDDRKSIRCTNGMSFAAQSICKLDVVRRFIWGLKIRRTCKEMDGCPEESIDYAQKAIRHNIEQRQCYPCALLSLMRVIYQFLGMVLGSQMKRGRGQNR